MSDGSLPRNSSDSYLGSAASPLSSFGLNLCLEASYESLAWHLRHFDRVLGALQELRSAFFKNEHALSDNEFRLSAPKIMDLLEVAKSTLEEAGIDLWLHSLCVVGLRPHKKAYFAVLKLLKSRADCLDAQLQARSFRLTCRLSSNFFIRTNPLYDFCLPPKPRKSQKTKMIDSQLPLETEFCKSMPPPDAFPPSGFTPISSRSLLYPQRRRRRMRLEFSNEVWESLGLAPPSNVPDSRTIIHDHYASTHIRAGALGSRRPGSLGMKQRFGILSTGSGSISGRRGKVQTRPSWL